MRTAKELFDELNVQDESTQVEAKGAGPINRSVMESVCSFSNEPGLGGGYILIGATKDDRDLFPYYTAEDIGDTDKLQSDLATQCNTLFNIPVRPRIEIERVNNANVMVVQVDELATGQKPLYFKKDGLPQGAYRRIGPTDHRCTEDDMPVFYTDQDTYDRTVIKRTTKRDVDLAALDLYRTLRTRVNPAAEELTFDDDELLLALGCLDPDSRRHLTVAGLLLFGSSAALRREMPMVRADYIRVPGTEWVADPDNRFRTVDMRGPLITLVYRMVEAVHADLPKGFMLEEGKVQADSTGLPVKALREAIVNAFMHRSYRVNSPAQVIRYDNRIEIRNPGYSLKSEDSLGTPGSETRNPSIAAVFHDTNLAETKGSGIRAMRRLLEQAHLAPPTFESDRGQNLFTARLLLHHFLSEDDLRWLMSFDHFDLNDNQKRGLIMLRELGAIDNLSYRQQSGTDTLTASQELRAMRDLHLLEMKGKGSKTHYVAGRLISGQPEPPVSVAPGAMTQPGFPKAQPPDPKAQPPGVKTQAPQPKAQPKRPDQPLLPDLLAQLTTEEQKALSLIKKRMPDPAPMVRFILLVCARRPHTRGELSALLGREERALGRNLLTPLLQEGKLKFRFPEVVNHPDQAYVSTGK